MTTLVIVICLVHVVLTGLVLVFRVMPRVREAHAKLYDVESTAAMCIAEIGAMKANLGRRMAELRLEKETILRRRGPAAWFARQIGWHVRPDQWGAIAERIDADELEALLCVFDVSEDFDLRASMAAATTGLQALRAVADEKQLRSLDRLHDMLRNPSKTPRRDSVVRILEVDDTAPSDTES